MKLFSTFLALGFALSAATTAHADTVDVFDYDASQTNGYTATGTLTIDVTTGNLESETVNLYTNLTLDDTFTATNAGPQGNPFWFSDSQDGKGGFYQIRLPVYLTGYAGGSACSESYNPFPCNGEGEVYAGATGFTVEKTTSATLTLETPPVDPTPGATAPEPSSLALLGTGLLGVAGVSRRRALRA
jgi:hypothetical protein